jgi:hypothetical protein
MSPSPQGAKRDAGKPAASPRSTADANDGTGAAVPAAAAAAAAGSKQQEPKAKGAAAAAAAAGKAASGGKGRKRTRRGGGPTDSDGWSSGDTGHAAAADGNLSGDCDSLRDGTASDADDAATGQRDAAGGGEQAQGQGKGAGGGLMAAATAAAKAAAPQLKKLQGDAAPGSSPFKRVRITWGGGGKGGAATAATDAAAAGQRKGSAADAPPPAPAAAASAAAAAGDAGGFRVVSRNGRSRAGAGVFEYLIDSCDQLLLGRIKLSEAGEGIKVGLGPATAWCVWVALPVLRGLGAVVTAWHAPAPMRAPPLLPASFAPRLPSCPPNTHPCTHPYTHPYTHACAPGG